MFSELKWSIWVLKAPQQTLARLHARVSGKHSNESKLRLFLAKLCVLALILVLRDVAYQHNGGRGGWLGFLALFHCPVHKSNAKANKQLCASKRRNRPVLYKHSLRRPGPDKTSTYSRERGHEPRSISRQRHVRPSKYFTSCSAVTRSWVLLWNFHMKKSEKSFGPTRVIRTVG